MSNAIRLRFVFMVALVAAVSTAAAASAHEDDLVGDGRYQMIVGFLVEPAFVGEKNGLQLYVARLASMATPEPGDADPTAPDEVFDRPVEGLQDTLQAEVIYGGQRLALPLEPVFGSPGEYVAYVFPMAEGDYGFRIFGTIEGVAVDETFISSPNGFSPVLPRVEFPTSVARSRDGVAGLPTFSGALGVVGIAIGAMAYARRRGLA